MRKNEKIFPEIGYSRMDTRRERKLERKSLLSLDRKSIADDCVAAECGKMFNRSSGKQFDD